MTSVIQPLSSVSYVPQTLAVQGLRSAARGGPATQTATATAGSSYPEGLGKKSQTSGQTGHVALHEVLSILNPLQYLPVVGTIYRAVTGDQIPEAAKRIGSLIVSTLMGGPVGAAIDVATMVAEKITGFHPDKVGQELVDDVINKVSGGSTAQPTPVVAVPVQGTAFAAADGWSAAQRMAAGITSSGDGGLRQGSLSGADMLNALELSRLRASKTYGPLQDAGRPSSLHTLA